jgi:hypothetical protein
MVTPIWSNSFYYILLNLHYENRWLWWILIFSTILKKYLKYEVYRAGTDTGL